MGGAFRWVVICLAERPRQRYTLAAPGVLIKVASSLRCVVQFGVYEFEPYAGELRREGIRVHLEGQPLAILKVLLERPGELVTREELQKKLWTGDTFVDFEHS